MQTTSFSWLHLTDLHFGLQGQDSLWPNLRQPFLDDLEELHRHTGPWQAVLFTGDLVQQGKSAEFAAMQKEVLDRMWEKLSELGSGDAVLLAVPGNHDLYRPDPIKDNPAVDGLLDVDGFPRIAGKFWGNSAGTYRTIINETFAAYSQWWQATPQRPPDMTHGILPGDFACTLPCGEQRIGIIGLNTSFLQLGGGDYKGKLVWDARQLHAVCDGAVDDWLREHDVCLLLTHQGPDWLSPEAQAHGASEIAPAGRFAAHLYGHMHETRLQYIQHGGNPDAVRLLQGCSVFGMEKFGEPPCSCVRMATRQAKSRLRTCEPPCASGHALPPTQPGLGALSRIMQMRIWKGITALLQPCLARANVFAMPPKRQQRATVPTPIWQ